MSVKKADTEPVLKLHHVTTDGRLLDAQDLRGAAKLEVICRREEIPELAEVSDHLTQISLVPVPSGLVQRITPAG